jgi:hypothetical protein
MVILPKNIEVNINERMFIFKKNLKEVELWNTEAWEDPD